MPFADNLPVNRHPFAVRTKRKRHAGTLSDTVALLQAGCVNALPRNNKLFNAMFMSRKGQHLRYQHVIA
ncbi:hypothetical protein EGK14_19840 [Erwinia sp. 198]|nr:hypothetical protein EGK14_19840 [Erwinia sp. 198]